jgi:hypothetical protein
MGNLEIDLAINATGRVKRDEGQGYHHQDNDGKSVDKKTSGVVHYRVTSLEPGVPFPEFSDRH